MGPVWFERGWRLGRQGSGQRSVRPCGDRACRPSSPVEGANPSRQLRHREQSGVLDPARQVAPTEFGRGACPHAAPHRSSACARIHPGLTPTTLPPPHRANPQSAILADQPGLPVRRMFLRVGQERQANVLWARPSATACTHRPAAGALRLQPLQQRHTHPLLRSKWITLWKCR